MLIRPVPDRGIPAGARKSPYTYGLDKWAPWEKKFSFDPVRMISSLDDSMESRFSGWVRIGKKGNGPTSGTAKILLAAGS